MPEDHEDDYSGPPPPPDERNWRHPSELGSSGATHPITFVTRSVRRAPMSTWMVGLLAFLAGAAGTLAVVTTTGAFRTVKQETSAIEKQYVDLEGNPEVPIEIAEKVLPAVVRIEANGPAGPDTGTAVIVASNGYLLTSADLVDGVPPESITATFNDGQVAHAASVALDVEVDIAVLKVDRTGLPVAVMGRSAAKLQLGEPVLAIDSTVGGAETPHMPPLGVVNGLSKTLHTDDRANTLYGMIQTNVDLVSPAPGAPLVDVKGAVIGIMTSRGYALSQVTPVTAATGSAGHADPRSGDSAGAPATTGTARNRSGDVTFRYATPIDFARRVYDALAKDGRYPKATLGIDGTDLTAEEAQRWEVDGGVKIGAVKPASAAAIGELRSGDIIIKIEDERITSWDSLVVALRNHQPYESVSVWIRRPGVTEQQPAIVRLDERTSPAR